VGCHTSARSTNLTLLPSPIRQAVASARGTSRRASLQPRGRCAHPVMGTRGALGVLRQGISILGLAGACNCAVGCILQPLYPKILSWASLMGDVHLEIFSGHSTCAPRFGNAETVVGGAKKTPPDPELETCADQNRWPCEMLSLLLRY
jgi:hypothetical protein